MGKKIFSTPEEIKRRKQIKKRLFIATVLLLTAVTSLSLTYLVNYLI